MTKSVFIDIKCPLCDGINYKILYKSTLVKNDFSPNALAEHFKNSLSDYSKHGQIVKCSNCFVVYVNPVENLNTYLKAYQDVVDNEYLETEKFRKILSQKHLTYLQKYKKRGLILDVGCFAGFFLELAQSNKWNIYGIEPSNWAGSYAKKRGIKVLGKTVQNTNLDSYKFDAITMWDVIEHLSDPSKTIKKLSKSLKKNGIIAIGTPNVESLMFKILRGNHPYFIRMHLILFSPKTLTHLLESNGFEILETYTYGRVYSIDYFLSRIQTKISIIKYLRQFTTHKFFHEYPLTLNLRDEFTIIARKK